MDALLRMLHSDGLDALEQAEEMPEMMVAEAEVVAGNTAWSEGIATATRSEGRMTTAIRHSPHHRESAPYR